MVRTMVHSLGCIGVETSSNCKLIKALIRKHGTSLRYTDPLQSSVRGYHLMITISKLDGGETMATETSRLKPLVVGFLWMVIQSTVWLPRETRQ